MIIRVRRNAREFIRTDASLVISNNRPTGTFRPSATRVARSQLLESDGFASTSKSSLARKPN